MVRVPIVSDAASRALIAHVDNFELYALASDNEVGGTVELTQQFYTPGEVAALARVHRSTILNYIASGRLYAVKLSERTYRIPARAVLRLLEPERLSEPTITEEPYATVSLDDYPGDRPASRIAER